MLLYIECVKRLYPDNFMWFPKDIDLVCEIDKSNRSFPSTWFGQLSDFSRHVLDINFVRERNRIQTEEDFKIPDSWFEY